MPVIRKKNHVNETKQVKPKKQNRTIEKEVNDCLVDRKVIERDVFGTK